MRTKTTVLFVILLIPLLQINVSHMFPVAVAEATQTQEVYYTIRVSETYDNRGTQIVVLPNDFAAISLFMNNSWQTVTLINHTYQLQSIKVDQDGNHYAVPKLPSQQFKPNEKISYSTAYQVVSKVRQIPEVREANSGTLSQIPQNLKQRYCREEGPWQDFDQLQTLAQNLARGEAKVLSIVETFISWIWQNIKYETLESPRYPIETFTSREGDCDDQANLLIALCRITEIPAYLQIGWIYMPEVGRQQYEGWNGHLKSVVDQIVFHGWAIVYIPPWGWLPVDLTYVDAINPLPLDAIKKGAVTSQITIQYMNVTHSDHIATNMNFGEWVINNSIYVTTEDQMSVGIPDGRSPPDRKTVAVATIAIVVLMPSLVLLVSFTMIALARRPKPKMPATPLLMAKVCPSCNHLAYFAQQSNAWYCPRCQRIFR